MSLRAGTFLFQALLMRKLAILCGLLVFAHSPLHAAGPGGVASIDRSLWPEALNSQSAFDRASRAEVLSFGRALSDSERMNDDALRDAIGVKQLDRMAVDHMRAVYWQRLAANYRMASADCRPGDDFCEEIANETDFRRVAARFEVAREGRYARWYPADQAFQRTYLHELLRLASLFSRVSSEVDIYSDRELTGNELADRQFLLTFDDGPSRADGNTDKLLATLRQRHLSATFFVLGTSLQQRLGQTSASQLATTYQGMCVGTHGWEHKSHGTWAEWQGSIERSMSLVRSTVPASATPLFRPPYGQRRSDSGPFFASHGLRVALWNIDSQDWSAKVDADQVRQRVLTLMLLWRRGVILFHDIHPKALTAVPWLLDQTSGANVKWIDCQSYR
ncbi:hypothetical protein LMG26411_03441 [Cupriavidus numazuensis]|uniref:NodB homology domain-containing protein n=2 Tax=Cupriavidus numazuensis TaxID=221992 RepID=A0ABN7Q2S4_9BURK|nr:hypothetical protein LMG26411_03441 [Cupriavidus numazuensis]